MTDRRTADGEVGVALILARCARGMDGITCSRVYGVVPLDCRQSRRISTSGVLVLMSRLANTSIFAPVAALSTSPWMTAGWHMPRSAGANGLNVS